MHGNRLIKIQRIYWNDEKRRCQYHGLLNPNSFDFDVTLTGGKKSTMIYHFKNCKLDKLNDLCLSLQDTQKLNVVVDFKVGDYEVELK